MDAPVGSESAYERMKPIRNADTLSATAITDTRRYVLATFIALSAGKISSEEISIEPSILMPTTITRDVRTARRLV